MPRHPAVAYLFLVGCLAARRARYQSASRNTMNTTIDSKVDVALLSLAELYLYVYRRDHAFHHILADPRAKEIEEGDIVDLWRANSLTLGEAWAVKGLGPMCLASIHYWQKQIDFACIDVGANIGMTAIIFAIFHKRCGRANRIFAFEPGEVFPLPEKSMEVNRVSDIVTCVQAAASDMSGTAQFYLTPAQSPASSLLAAAVHRPEVTLHKPVVVKTVTLDEFLDARERTSGIVAKIDAEGADFKVLDGMKKTISDRLCTVQIEFFPSLIDTYADAVARLASLTADFHLLDAGASPRRLIGEDSRAIERWIAHVRALPGAPDRHLACAKGTSRDRSPPCPTSPGLNERNQ